MDNNAMKIKFDKVVLDCIDPKALADFYAQLLGWKIGYVTDDFVIIGSEASNVDIGFQKNTDFVQPTWPEENGRQQQMLHLDFALDHAELKGWAQKAVSLGAKVAGTQYSDHWMVMLDPEGHPFCFDAV